MKTLTNDKAKRRMRKQLKKQQEEEDAAKERLIKLAEDKKRQEQEEQDRIRYEQEQTRLSKQYKPKQPKEASTIVPKQKEVSSGNTTKSVERPEKKERVPRQQREAEPRQAQYRPKQKPVVKESPSQEAEVNVVQVSQPTHATEVSASPVVQSEPVYEEIKSHQEPQPIFTQQQEQPLDHPAQFGFGGFQPVLPPVQGAISPEAFFNQVSQMQMALIAKDQELFHLRSIIAQLQSDLEVTKAAQVQLVPPQVIVQSGANDAELRLQIDTLSSSLLHEQQKSKQLNVRPIFI